MNKQQNSCQYLEHFALNKLLPVCRQEMHRPATLHALQPVENKNRYGSYCCVTPHHFPYGRAEWSFSAFSSFSRRFSVIRTLFASHFPVGQDQDIN